MNTWTTLIHDNDYEIMNEEPFSIRKKSTGRIIAECNNGNGYIVVFLNHHKFYKHRIIAETFIPNPNNFKEVDHISGIRNDNRLKNLRWVSHSMNMKNRGSSRNVIYNYVDEINDEAIIVNHYSDNTFDDLYFDPENNVFYFFNGVRYRELPINERRSDGALFVYHFDSNNKRRKIFYSNFKREYHLI